MVSLLRPGKANLAAVARLESEIVMNHSTNYQPEQYWETVVGRRFDLREVGYPNLSLVYNHCLYKAMSSSVDRALRLAGVTQSHFSTSSVLDVGSGVGYWIEYWLAKGVEHLKGVDLTSASVSHLAQRYPKLDFEQRDIADPADADAHNAFDLISAMSILNHIPSQERWEQALVNLGNLLKPGGLIFIMDPILKYRWWGEPFDSTNNGRPRTIAEHTAILGKTGVTVELVTPTITLLANPVDTKSKLEFRLLERWWHLFSRVAADEYLMSNVCGPVYGADRLLARLNYMPSSKIIVGRKSASH